MVELADSYAPGQASVSIPLSQAQLADLVGATCLSVNQVLQRHADQQLVELGRCHIEQPDVAALAPSPVLTRPRHASLPLRPSPALQAV
jgi:CRP/FNR family transcriptional regulator, cyclic AMP receptor protein